MGSRRANGLDDADDPASYPPELARLPPGRHGLAREFVEENQHRRLISGLAIAAAEHGYRGATIAHITQKAAVSRRTFYEHFASKDECFAAAYEAVIDELRDRIEAAFGGGGDWPHALGEAIRAALRFLAENPSLARLVLVEAVVAGPSVVGHYDGVIQIFVPCLRAGREGRPPEALPPLSPTIEEAVAGGIVSLVSRRVVAGEGATLEELAPDLIEFSLVPYLGSAEAARVAREGSVKPARPG